jgi:hypothetical protein
MTDQRSSSVTEEMVNTACGIYERVYIDDDKSMHEAMRDALIAVIGAAQGRIDRGELVAMLTDLASVNMSSEVAGRQATRMADALIAKGIGGPAYTEMKPITKRATE